MKEYEMYGGHLVLPRLRDLVSVVCQALEMACGWTRDDYWIDYQKSAVRIKVRGAYITGIDPAPADYGFDVDTYGKPYTPARVFEYLINRQWEEIDSALEELKVHPWDRRRVRVGATKPSPGSNVYFMAVWIARSADDE